MLPPKTEITVAKRQNGMFLAKKASHSDVTIFYSIRGIDYHSKKPLTIYLFRCYSTRQLGANPMSLVSKS